MANKFQVKRTTVSGRTPNTTSSGNTHFIDTGELALNLTDRKLFSSNGSVSFEVGANLSNLVVAGDANVGGKLSVTASSGDEGGEIFLAAPANTTLGGGVTIDAYQNKIRFFEQGGSARGAFIDLTQCAGGAGTNLLTGGSGIAQVNTGNGLTGGPITDTGTISVLANSGVIANATGLYVNSTYIATLAANSATYLGGNTALDLRNYSDTQAGAAYSNAVTYASNANNISSGTLDAARLPATVVQNTDSRTLSGNLVISGTYFNPSSNTILLGNSTQRWVLSANTGSFSGAVTGITTLAAGNTTVTGFVNATSTIQGGSSLTIAGALSGVTTAAMGNTTITGFANVTSTIQGGSSLTIAGALSGVTTAAMGNTTVTGFANVTSTIQGGSSLTIAGALSGVTTAAMGNTTITGFANASVSVNSALLTVGTDFIANTQGAYHTGTVNAASFTTTNFVANTSGAYPLSNSAGTALGLSTRRWVISANSGDFSGQIISTDTWDTADGNGAIYLNAATGNRIDWNINGVAAPAVTTRSVGTKLVLYPAVSATTVDYGIGIESNHQWYSVAGTDQGHKWYANTTHLYTANTTGIVVNSGGVLPISNSTATALGSSTRRWVITANSITTSGSGSIGTTLAAGNTTITGFANVSDSVNSALLTVGTSFTANTSRLHAGNSSVNTYFDLTTGYWYVNGPSFAGGIVPGSNTTGNYLGDLDRRWDVYGGFGDFSDYVDVGTEIVLNTDKFIANTSGIVVGNLTSGYISSGCTTPSSTRGIQTWKVHSSDASTAGVYVDIIQNNATLTAARSVVGVQSIAVSNTADANSTGGVLGSDGYGVYSLMYNAETAAANARINNMYAGYFIARNYAGGATANTVDAAHGGYFSVGVYGPGNITTAYGSRVLIAPANTTVAGGITTAYGYFANVQSNTASAVANATLFHGIYNGTNFTGEKFGVYVSGESNNYFSSNVTIAGGINVGGSGFIANSTAIVLGDPVTANGSTGTAGQVLTSNGTTGSPYWSTVSSGGSVTVTDDTSTNGTRYLAFANQTSGTLSTIFTDSTGLTFNPSTGTVTAAVFSATSDERQKTNINTITDSLTKIQKIKGITFDYKQSGNPGVGVLAQDVEQVFPELVSINNEGYKSVAYDGLIGLLIEVVKDQQQQIQVLSEKIDRIMEMKQ